MKKFVVRSVLIVVVLAISGIFVNAAESPKKFTIGYSQFWGTNPFLVAMTGGAEKAVAEWQEQGIEVNLIVTNGGDTDTSRQVADCEDLYAQGVDGLLIFPGDSILLAEPIKNIYNKYDIPVVITDIGLESGEYVSFIITDNYLGGQMAAEHLATVLPKGAKVVTFDNGPGNANAQKRQAGFEDRAKELGFEVLPEKMCKLALEEGKRLMEDTLTATPDIGAVFFITQVVAQGGVSALEAAGNTDVKIVGFDIDANTYQMVKDGRISGMVIQDPFLMGYEGMNQVLSYLTGGTVQKQIDVPAKLCTAENIEEFINDPQVQ